jgi:hypothetical protein
LNASRMGEDQVYLWFWCGMRKKQSSSKNGFGLPKGENPNDINTARHVVKDYIGSVYK